MTIFFPAEFAVEEFYCRFFLRKNVNSAIRRFVDGHSARGNYAPLNTCEVKIGASNARNLVPYGKQIARRVLITTTTIGVASARSEIVGRRCLPRGAIGMSRSEAKQDAEVKRSASSQSEPDYAEVHRRFIKIHYARVNRRMPQRNKVSPPPPLSHPVSELKEAAPSRPKNEVAEATEDTSNFESQRRRKDRSSSRLVSKITE